MGFFSVDYRNVPGQCVYAQGGLKFRADEDALCRYFAPILPYVSLNDLIGEALFWFMLPSTLAIWIFPFLLYSRGIFFAVIATAALYLLVKIWHMFLYIKSVNYLVFILGNPIPELVAYIVWAIIFISSDYITKIIILGVWFLGFKLGIDEVFSSIFYFAFLPIQRAYFKKIKKFLFLPLSDQILINIGWYYAKKFGIDPTKWKMYDRETGNDA